MHTTAARLGAAAAVLVGGALGAAALFVLSPAAAARIWPPGKASPFGGQAETRLHFERCSQFNGDARACARTRKDVCVPDQHAERPWECAAFSSAPPGAVRSHRVQSFARAWASARARGVGRRCGMQDANACGGVGGWPVAPCMRARLPQCTFEHDTSQPAAAARSTTRVTLSRDLSS